MKLFPVEYAKLKYYKLQQIKLKFYHIFRLISADFRLKMPKMAKKVPWILADVHKDG